MKKFLPIFIIGFLMTTGFVFAANLDNPLKDNSFKDIIDTLINFVTILAVAIAPIFFLYGGFLMMTSAGDTTKLKKAKDLFLYTILGLAILFLGKGLIEVLKSVIGITGTGK